VLDTILVTRTCFIQFEPAIAMWTYFVTCETVLHLHRTAVVVVIIDEDSVYQS